jgi:LysM repeat protein
MKTVIWLPVACAFLLILPSCETGVNQPGASSATGPFDSNGNYREEWADNPSKWRKSSSAPSPHELRSDVIPEIAKSEQPPESANPLPPKSTSSSTTPSTKTKPIVVASRSSSAVRSSTSKTTKPKTTTASKPVSKSTRYIVKSGDSLSAIASRYGASISGIQRANGISGTMIRPGQALTIPKK